MSVQDSLTFLLMKLVKQQLEKDLSGFVTLVPEDKEDHWTLYNLLQKGDEVRVRTHRNVARGKKTERIPLTLRLKVELIDYEPGDESLRLRGPTVDPHDDVPIGLYHLAEVVYNVPVTVYKLEWDQVAYDVITKACRIESKAELGAVVLQEGVAHLCLLTDSMTVLVHKQEKLIPKKRRGDALAHDKAVQTFLTATAQLMRRHFDLTRLKAVVLALPGYVAQQLSDVFFDLATKAGDKATLAARAKFVVGHLLTGYLQGLEEALRSPEMVSRLAATKYAQEAAVLDRFMEALNRDDLRAWYGPEECQRALDLGAVRTLLLTDTLFRLDDLAQRKHYIAMADQARAGGADVAIFSLLHELGQQLDQLTGVAVLLSHPVDLDEDD